MKKVKDAIALMIVVSTVGLSPSSQAENGTDSSGGAEQGWIVDFEDDAEAASVAQLLKGLIGGFNFTGPLTAGRRVELGALTPAVRSRLEQHPMVESLEPNQHLGLFLEASETHRDDEDRSRSEGPNDPMYASQWHFDMIDLEDAWPHAQGERVTVAVVDTGVSFGKLEGKTSRFARVPDLRETAFVPGYNFVDNNDDPSDDHGHGTHVAGTIAQSTNNGLGVAGIAPKAAIMPIKVLAKSGGGSLGGISKGIRWAADNGANVINLSLGGGFYSPTMHRAIKYAHRKGVALVCAAGNTGRARVEYPARYPECIAVSSVGPDGKLAFYSSHGEELALAAPGGDTRVDLNKDGIPDGVLQNTIGIGDPTQHGYFPFQGTSMASPHVAGVAALLFSSGVTDPDAIAEILTTSAEKRDDVIKYGAGVLRGGQAFDEAHRDEALHRTGAAALLATLALFGIRGRKRRLFGPAVLFAFTAGVLGIFSTAGASPFAWVGAAFGPEVAFHPLATNILWVLMPSLFLWGVRNTRPYLGAFALGASVFLIAQALLGTVNVPWVPGHGLADASWLMGNGLLAFFWARFLFKHADA